MPTEAEWEYAARGGSTWPRYGVLEFVAWNKGNSDNKTHLVGQKQPSGFGLHDMLGNVAEWTGDRYEKYEEGSALSRDPQGPSNGEYRVVRGGTCDDGSSAIRASYRVQGFPGGRNSILGVRCAATAANH